MSTKEIYICSSCNKQFSDINYLNTHIPMCNALFCCEVCRSLFQSLEEVKLHIEQNHGELLLNNASNANATNITESHINPLEESTSVYFNEDTEVAAEEVVESSDSIEMSVIGSQQQTRADTVAFNAAFPPSERCGSVASGGSSRDKFVYSRTAAGQIGYTGGSDAAAATACQQYSDAGEERWIGKRLEDELKCKLCHVQFNSPLKLREHWRGEHHMGSKAFPCSTCGAVFATPHHLNQHVSFVHSDKRYECDLCGEQFGRGAFLADHMKALHPKRRKQAQPVHVPSPAAAAAEAPGVGVFACHACTKMFDSQEELEEHVRAHVPVCPPKAFPCSLCAHVATTHASLARHLSADHPDFRDEDETEPYVVENGDGRSSCAKCGKRFQDPAILRRHIRVRHIMNPAAAVDDEAAAATGGQVQHYEPHLQQGGSVSNTMTLDEQSAALTHVVHSGFDVHGFSAAGDEQLVPTAAAAAGLLEHDPTSVLIPTKLARYECVECGESFKKFARLQAHEDLFHPSAAALDLLGNPDPQYPGCSGVRTERASRLPGGGGGMAAQQPPPSLERPFACPECNKSFKCKSHLRQHLRYHTGEKPFKCDICEAGFHLSGDRNRHVIKMHSDYRPFKCAQCDRAFVDRYTLGKHELLHRPRDLAFRCGGCLARFPDRLALSRHAASCSTQYKS